MSNVRRNNMDKEVGTNKKFADELAEKLQEEIM